MAGEKRFRTSFIGFKKYDVNLYIEKILKEFEERLREKDEEISLLKMHITEIKSKYEELSQKADQINDARAKIADVLIKAQEKAELMMEDAINQANQEKKKIDSLVEMEKEKLVDIKAEIKTLKYEVVNTLKKYEDQLSDMILEDEKVG